MAPQVEGREEPQVDKVPCLTGPASLGGARGVPTNASQDACGPERGKDFDSLTQKAAVGVRDQEVNMLCGEGRRRSGE